MNPDNEEAGTGGKETRDEPGRRARPNCHGGQSLHSPNNNEGRLSRLCIGVLQGSMAALPNKVNQQ